MRISHKGFFGMHKKNKCLTEFIRTFGWPMGAVLYDLNPFFKHALLRRY
jgi:hypothetical protein